MGRPNISLPPIGMLPLSHRSHYYDHWEAFPCPLGDIPFRLNCLTCAKVRRLENVLSSYGELREIK